MRKRIVITRRFPTSADGDGVPPATVPNAISLDEWLAHVDASPDLACVRLAANENEALRAAHPVWLVDRGSDGWLYWIDGEIRADGPDPALFEAMVRIARALGVGVRIDEESSVRVSGDAPPGISENEVAIVERRTRQALFVAGTVACVASVMWLVQA